MGELIGQKTIRPSNILADADLISNSSLLVFCFFVTQGLF